MLVATIVVLGSAIARSLGVHRALSAVVGAVAGLCVLTVMFAPGSAILGILPSPDTLEEFRLLEVAARTSIASQSIPATADVGIVYMVCVGIALVTAAMDALVNVARTPSLSGVALLVMLLVPSFVRAELNDPYLFALTAIVYLAILLVAARPQYRQTGVAIAGAALALALVVSIALPAIDSGDASVGTGSIAAGINPIVTLGNDLRRADPTLALTYTTTQEAGVYLRLAVLDTFSGVSWEPTENELIATNQIESIGPPPGLTDIVATTPVTTDITVSSILTRWLPAPYAPASVAGLEGDWFWEPDGLTMRTTGSNASDQAYEVQSLRIAPSIDQLRAAPPEVSPDFTRYLSIPEDLPAVVSETARTVAGGQPTAYDQAIALQEFFRSGDFVYSEDAPVDQGYDGSGAQVLEKFLDVRSGYCVHFSSAMASMARVLGIPARVAVGFTPGEATLDPATQIVEYRVSTDNFHAWPELYFEGIGWVRFEPTPGRGEVPTFAALAVDDPATPGIDESVPPPAATPAPVTTSTAAPVVDTSEPQPSAADDSGGSVGGFPVGWVVASTIALLAVMPLMLRSVTRARRYAQVRGGSARAGWDEVRATADDFGLNTSDQRTPRQLRDDVHDELDPDARRALDRLLDAVETDAFSKRESTADVADVRTICRSLRRGAGLASRLIGTVAPRSLLNGWLIPAIRAR